MLTIYANLRTLSRTVPDAPDLTPIPVPASG
jgi:hypothetical protein